MERTRYLTDLQVCNAIKRYKPSKHYVYSIWVTWSDNVKQLIFRRYSEFFNLQCKLIDRFQDEAGANDPSNRILPFLPGKIIFGRSHVKSVALDRLHPIGIYCKKLITLKKEISQSDLVISFFSVTNDDITQSSRKESIKMESEDIQVKNISEPIRTEEYICIHDYKALSKNELSIRKDTKCYVIEKNLSGWWFVDSTEGQGFIPQCIIKPLNSTSEKLNSIEINEPEMNVVRKDYKKKRADELTIKKGDFVHVLQKNFNGWWKVRKDIDNSIGMVPAVFLQPVSSTNINDSQKTSIPAFQLFSNSQNDDYENNSLPTPESTSYNQPNFNDPRNKSIPSNESMYNRQSTIFDTQKTSIPGFELLSDQRKSETFSQYEDLDFLNQNIYENISSYDETNNFAPMNPVDIVQEDEIYYAIESYQDLVGDGIDLFKGQKITVLSKDSSTGWWYVKLNETNEGWAPSAYLSKIKPSAPARPPPPKINTYEHLLNKPKMGINERIKSNLNIEEIYSKPFKKENNNNDLNFVNANRKSTESKEEVYIPIKVSDMKKRFE